MQSLEQEVPEAVRPRVHRVAVANRWLTIAVIILGLVVVGLVAWIVWDSFLADPSENEMVSTIEETVVAWNQGDAEAVASAYAADAVLVTPEGRVYVGRSEIEQIAGAWIMAGFSIEETGEFVFPHPRIVMLEDVEWTSPTAGERTLSRVLYVFDGSEIVLQVDVDRLGSY